MNGIMWNARTTDPATSQRAAQPKRESLKSRILARLEVYPSTGWELHVALGAPLNSVTPRFAELRREGKIMDSGLKKDGEIIWKLCNALVEES